LSCGMSWMQKAVLQSDTFCNHSVVLYQIHCQFATSNNSVCG
jgi:hypothetical protein